MKTILIMMAFQIAVSGQSPLTDRVSKLKLIVVDSFGSPVRGDTRVSIKGEASSKELTIQTRGFVELPPGTYTVRCSSVSYQSAIRIITIQRAEQHVVFGLAMKTPDQQIGEGSEIRTWVLSGQIEPRSSSSPVIARLTGVFSNLSSEAEVNPKGEFSLNVSEQGKYTLVILADGNVVYRKELDIDISVPLSLKLGRLQITQTGHK